MNIGMHVSFLVMVSSEYMTTSEITESYGVLVLVLGRISILFSIVIAPAYILTSSVGRLPFLHTLSSIIVCRLFDDGHSDLCEVIPH